MTKAGRGFRPALQALLTDGLSGHRPNECFSSLTGRNPLASTYQATVFEAKDVFEEETLSLIHI